MFMRFRGGGIGHKITREWDAFLQSDGAPSQEDPEANEDAQDVLVGDIDLKEDVETEDLDSNEGENDEQEEPEDEDPDKVVADSDEELDDDILAQEGYGAL